MCEFNLNKKYIDNNKKFLEFLFRANCPLWILTSNQIIFLYFLFLVCLPFFQRYTFLLSLDSAIRVPNIAQKTISRTKDSTLLDRIFIVFPLISGICMSSLKEMFIVLFVQNSSTHFYPFV